MMYIFCFILFVFGLTLVLSLVFGFILLVVPQSKTAPVIERNANQLLDQLVAKRAVIRRLHHQMKEYIAIPNISVLSWERWIDKDR